MKNQMTNKISLKTAKKIWLSSQKLDVKEPWGAGPEAVFQAIKHLGYVQIDTISVIERCHHHILWNRIPKYKRSDLHDCLSVEKNIHEGWTHALAYIPTEDFKYFLGALKKFEKEPNHWFKSEPQEIKRVLNLLKKEGPLSIRDVKDEVLVEKDHEWASRKPSKKVLQYLFHSGRVVTSERIGMLKKYDLTERHFGWDQMPKAASEKEVLEYRLQRALRSQGIISIDSIDHLRPRLKVGYRKLIEAHVKAQDLVPVQVEGLDSVAFWMRSGLLEFKAKGAAKPMTHILSPFDPLIIQRKRLEQLFGYKHLFEAYIPIEKRVYGYFTLPVVHGDDIVAMIDLKTDRVAKKVLIQSWHWRPGFKSAELKQKIEAEIGRFEKFQLAK